MQAIITRILPATNTKPTRIKAKCARGQLTISQPMELSGDDAHAAAAEQLCAKFIWDDTKQYGTPSKKNPWGRKRIIGTLPSGDVAHVFTS